MAQAKDGDTVTVHYTGKLEDGTVFDASSDDDPLQFTIGAGEVIPGFEKAVVGMSLGESKTAQIPADEAFGARRDELVLTVHRDRFPAHLEPEVNQHLRIGQADGEALVVTVTEVSESTVKLDANHPLAGQDLTFNLRLVAIL